MANILPVPSKGLTVAMVDSHVRCKHHITARSNSQTGLLQPQDIHGAIHRHPQTEESCQKQARMVGAQCMPQAGFLSGQATRRPEGNLGGPEAAAYQRKEGVCTKSCNAASAGVDLEVWERREGGRYSSGGLFSRYLASTIVFSCALQFPSNSSSLTWKWKVEAT